MNHVLGTKTSSPSHGFRYPSPHGKAWPWGIPNFETKPDEDAQNLMFNLG